MSAKPNVCDISRLALSDLRFSYNREIVPKEVISKVMNDGGIGLE